MSIFTYFLFIPLISLALVIIVPQVKLNKWEMQFLLLIKRVVVNILN